MGIRVRNLHNVTLRLRSAGTLTAATDKDVATVPFDGYISNIAATVVGGGTGSTASVVDVHYLGTTIFGTATKITLAATTGAATYASVTTQSVTAGAYFTMDIDSISNAPTNLEVLITLTRTAIPNGGETHAVNQDTVY